MKLEDPKSKTCFLPNEILVYEDLQKSETRYFISSTFDYFKLFFVGAPNLLEKGFANIIDHGVYKGKTAMVMTPFWLDLTDYAIVNRKSQYMWNELRVIAINAVDKCRHSRFNQADFPTFLPLDR